MAKRKLNRRQQWRVEKIQKERLARAEKKAARLDSESGGQIGVETGGRIIASFGAEFAVEPVQDDSLRAEAPVWRCSTRQNIDSLVCGDEVVWCPAANHTGVIVARRERRSLLSRPDFHQTLKPVAANVDQILIVSAVQPPLQTELIDRYLVAAETVEIEPILIVNKYDLAGDKKRAALEDTMAVYTKIGYRVEFVSNKRPGGLDVLVNLLRGRTSIFVGQSGVGKSSIIKALLPEQDIAIGALSEASGLGRHTTSVTRLYHFSHGGDLIDSPGVRDFALWNITPEQAIRGFREFREYLGHCRFNDCSHTVEPGCAIIEAVEQGHIHPRRLESYRYILRSLEETWNRSR